MKRLRPMAMAGVPGSVAPIASNSPPETCARYQVDGAFELKCGSLASIGLPVALRVPSTTQLLEPSVSPRTPPSRKSATEALPVDKSDTIAARDGPPPLTRVVALLWKPA